MLFRSSIQMNLSRVIGPAIGGVLYATLGSEGAAWVFAINAATYGFAVVGLLWAVYPRRTTTEIAEEGLRKVLFELQSTDWRTGRDLPSTELAEQGQLLYRLGAHHLVGPLPARAHLEHRVGAEEVDELGPGPSVHRVDVGRLETAYPRVVEEAVYQHPSVEECTVIGIDDSYRGQSPKAFVKLQAGKTLTSEELIQFLKDKLNPIEMPREIEFRAALPKTLIGKLSKKELVAEEAAKTQKA